MDYDNLSELPQIHNKECLENQTNQIYFSLQNEMHKALCSQLRVLEKDHLPKEMQSM